MLGSPVFAANRARSGVIAIFALLAAATLSAQEPAERRESVRVVSKAVTLGERSTRLRLEISDGRNLAIDFGDGELRLDGERVEGAGADPELYSSWRSLLVETTDFDHSGFQEALSSWTPPPGLDPAAAMAGRRIANSVRALLGADALGEPAPDASASVESGPVLERLQRRVGELESSLRDERAARESLEVLRAPPAGRDGGFSSALAGFVRGVADIVATLVAIGVVALLALLGSALAPNRIRVMAEVAKEAPGKSLVAGWMAGLLFLPGWIIPAVALAVTVIGALVVPLWLLAFPVAFAAAALAGTLAVSRNLGLWAIERDWPGTDWARSWNARHTVIAGVGVLALLPVAGKVVQLVPWFHFLGGVLQFAGWILIGVVASVGMGSAVLTRGGSRYPGDWRPLSAEDENYPNVEDDD